MSLLQLSITFNEELPAMLEYPSELSLLEDPESVESSEPKSSPSGMDAPFCSLKKNLFTFFFLCFLFLLKIFLRKETNGREKKVKR